MRKVSIFFTFICLLILSFSINNANTVIASSINKNVAYCEITPTKTHISTKTLTPTSTLTSTSTSTNALVSTDTPTLTNTPPVDTPVPPTATIFHPTWTRQPPKTATPTTPRLLPLNTPTPTATPVCGCCCTCDNDKMDTIIGLLERILTVLERAFPAK